MITANANMDMGPQAKDTATDNVEKRRKYLLYFLYKDPRVLFFFMAFQLKVTVHTFEVIIRIRVLFEEWSFRRNMVVSFFINLEQPDNFFFFLLSQRQCPYPLDTYLACSIYYLHICIKPNVNL